MTGRDKLTSNGLSPALAIGLPDADRPGFISISARKCNKASKVRTPVREGLWELYPALPSWANVSTPTIPLQFQRKPMAVELQQEASRHHTDHARLWEQSEKRKVKCHIDFPATGTSLEIRNQVPTS